MNLFQRYKIYASNQWAFLSSKRFPNCNLKIFAACTFLIILLPDPFLQAQGDLTLTGKVADERTKEPLAGATLSIAGSTNQVLTDEKGKFRFQTGHRIPITINVSYIGYQTEVVILTQPEGTVITLKQSTSQLNDVIISSGYITQAKKVYTGSAAQVSGAQLQNKPAQSFDQLLGGQATGVDIVQPSNSLNNTPVLRVRGINSINSGIYPLVVLDGVTLFTGSVGGVVGNNPLADIDPNDIETIDILKDASATAIYGSRAANGVLVITTKKGKKGKTKVNYNGWVSFSTPYNLPKLLDAADYVTIKNEAMVNAGKMPGFALQLDSNGRAVNTNWYDVAYHTGVSQGHNVNISGANETTSYYLSLNYTDQDGFIRNNGFSQTAARLNIEHHLSGRFVAGANISYSNSLNTGPNTGAIPAASTSLPTNNSQYIGTEPIARLTYILPPDVPVYAPDGSYSIQNGTSVGYGANNPSLVGTINAYNLKTILDLDRYSSENNHFTGNVYAQWTLVKGLNLKTSYGIDNLQVVNKGFLNPLNGDGSASNGAATNTNAKLYRTDWTNTLTYSVMLGERHHFTALGGYEQIDRTNNTWGAQETNLTDPFYDNYQGGWSNVTNYGNVLSENALISYFANLDYDFDKKYVLNFNLRRDGLSALAPGHKYGNFGGGSVGWNISEEPFFRNGAISNVISDLKIRGGYGIVGNSEIGDYPAIGSYSSGTYNSLPTLYFSQAGNPALKWEKSSKTDVGINVTLLRNHLSLDADYYYSKVDGLILQTPQAPSAGIPGNIIYANVGSLYNKGIEIGLNAHILSTRNFRWDAVFNFSTLQNKVTSLVSDVYSASAFGIQNMTRVGYSVGSIFAVPTVGVNPADGYRVFVNSQGKEVQYNQVGSPKWTYLDGTAAPAIDNYQDGRIQGSSLPTYFGGFNNTFTYKKFDLGIGITYSGGNKLYNGTKATISDQRYFNNGTFILNRWTHPGQVTNVPRLIYGDNISTGFSFTHTGLVEDGAYAKLKTITLGYSIPTNNAFLNGKISSAHLYVQATNLFTLTRYTGSDPEVSINGNSINGGKDQNVPPNARLFTVGLNVGF